MKTTNANFLTAQGLDTILDDFKGYLFEQWDYAITDRDDATHIKVQGDASSWLSNGDVFIIPLDDFDTYHTITSSPTYDGGSGKTTITCSGSSFGTGVVGLYVALRHIITSDVLRDGFSAIRIATEGETLNSSLADDVQITVNNDSETYFDNDGSSGLFNTGRIFWIQIIFKLTTDATEFLYFGGTVYLPSVQPISNLKTVEFLCHGHLKELERYPGFRITDENGRLPFNPGIETVSVVEPTGGVIESIRDLEFKFPDGQDSKNLIINGLSTDTPIGWHVIKFQPPDLWQYDFGSWTEGTEAMTDVDLTSAKGHIINVSYPVNFDIESREDWFYLASRLNLDAGDFGRFSLQFSKGKTVILKPTFDRVIFHDSSGASYSDISLYANTFDSDQKEIVGSANDEIWLMSKEPIAGVYLDLETDLDGTITWYYSTGYNTYATLTKTDGTSNLSQSGAVTWDIPADHLQIDDLINSVQYNNYYIIKVKCTVYVSGTCDLKRIIKHVQLIGDDGTKLNVRCKFEHLPTEDREDKIILRDDSSDVMQAHCWKENQSFYQYLQDIFTEASYSSGNQSVDNMYITASSEVISLLGRPPYHFYGKKPTAVLVDTSALHGSIKVYLGIEDELWSFDFENGYVFIDKLDPYVRASDDAYFKVEIKRLVLDGNSYIQGIAWKDYLDQPIDGKDYSDDFDKGRRTPAVVFRSTNKTAITEQNWIDSGGDSIFTSQEVCWRDGDAWSIPPSPDGTIIGSHENGENLCLPIPQYLWHLWDGVIAPVWGNATSLIDVGHTENELLPVFKTPGHFFVGTVYADTDLGVCFTLAQKGFVVWDEGNDVWIVQKWTGAAWKMSSVQYDGTVADLLELTNYTRQILAGCYYNAKIYYGLMIWDESGDTFPGDYSDCYLKRVDNDGNNDTTLFDFSADSVEANQSLAAGNEKYCAILDMVYNINEINIHGVLLDKSDFEYHYFVYDITNDKLYTSQTGTGFTFNKHRQIKELVYNATDYKVYAAVVDLRNKQETAFLINASYSVPGGAPDGTEITLTYEADIVNNEYDVQALTVYSGIVYGLTKPNYHYLFRYDENVYPVMFLNDSEEDSFRGCIDDLSQVLNMIHSIGPERKFYFNGRETNKGSTTIYEASNYLLDSIQPLKNWQHHYDGVEVEWENPFTGEKGRERHGTFGWQRRILKIKNRFIQYPQLAKLIAEVYDDFFSDYRLELGFRTYPLWQLDNRDKFQFSHSVNYFDFSAALWWIIQEINYDYWGGEMEIKALEMK